MAKPKKQANARRDHPRQTDPDEQEQLALRQAEAEQQRRAERAMRFIEKLGLDDWGAQHFLHRLSCRQDLPLGRMYCGIIQRMSDLTRRCVLELHKRLDGLKPEHERDMEIIRLRDRKKRKFREIDEHFGLNPGTARTYYWRKKKELRERNNW